MAQGDGVATAPRRFPVDNDDAAVGLGGDQVILGGEAIRRVGRGGAVKLEGNRQYALDLKCSVGQIAGRCAR